jgi:hypothetical protein
MSNYAAILYYNCPPVKEPLKKYGSLRGRRPCRGERRETCLLVWSVKRIDAALNLLDIHPGLVSING